ncbi:MAG TPA: hypothetical protein VF292_15535 [Rhodanobacteraceae bacterium]
MRAKLIHVVLLAAVVGALAACTPAPAVKPPPRPTASPETSYRLITPPGAPHYTLQPGQSASLPEPEVGHFAPPVYPAALAHPGMPPVVIKAQVTFGADGKANGVYVLSDSYAGAGHALFEDAVRKAAGAWQFTPLVFASYGDPAMDAGTLQSIAKPFSLWFEFSFRMVDGKPSTAVQRRTAAPRGRHR